MTSLDTIVWHDLSHPLTVDIATVVLNHLHTDGNYCLDLVPSVLHLPRLSAAGVITTFDLELHHLEEKGCFTPSGETRLLSFGREENRKKNLLDHTTLRGFYLRNDKSDEEGLFLFKVSV